MIGFLPVYWDRTDIQHYMSVRYTTLWFDFYGLVPKSYLTLCDSMDYNRPGFPVAPYLWEFVQTHVPWVDDAIQPSHPHPTVAPSPFFFSPSIPPSIRVFSKESLFTSGGQTIGASVSVLPINIQGWFPLGLTGLISLQSKGLSRVFSSTTVQKHQIFGAQISLWSYSHIHTWLLEKP